MCPTGRKEIDMRIATRVTALTAVFLILAFSAAAADSKNVEASPQAKAYRALMKAVAAGDFEGYKKSMTKQAAKGIDEQMKEMKIEPKKGMEMLQAMTPKDLKLTSVNVDGKKATLMATGKMDGELNKATIALEEEDGQWKVANQSWTNAK
jgi:hypothetical protein